MPLLLLLHDEALEGAISEELYQRRDDLQFARVESFDQARERLRSGSWDAVLVAPGPKELSFKRFLGQLAALPVKPRLLAWGCDLPGATRIEPGSPARVVSQLYAALGLQRSELASARVVELLGFSGPVQLELVEWPGAFEPLVRASLASVELDRATLGLAQRAAAVRGPGVAPMIEAFWDDAHPHTLHAVPPGVSLWQLLRQRSTLGTPLALAVVAGLVPALRTLHAAGLSLGRLDPSSVWLCDDGGVLVLGMELSQLPWARLPAIGLAREAPPEEFATALAPLVPGDAFRVGILLMVLAVGDDPLRGLTPVEHLRAEWSCDFGPHRPALGAATALIETLVQPLAPDRPRGELLGELLAQAAPPDARAQVAAAVAQARRTPYFRAR